MIIGAWVGYGFLVAIIIAVVVMILITSESVGVMVVTIICGFLASLLLLFGFKWWFTNTESGKRAMKTQESNFDGGIRRSVKVYDAVGNVLQEYNGTFDVDFSGDEQRILFDDENGMRHVIYFKTGTVIVEEVEDETDEG